MQVPQRKRTSVFEREIYISSGPASDKRYSPGIIGYITESPRAIDNLARARRIRKEMKPSKRKGYHEESSIIKAYESGMLIERNQNYEHARICEVCSYMFWRL